MNWVGIDYGSKMAGTTVIAFWKETALHFAQAPAKTDADLFITKWLQRHQPSTVYFDAPLSLPGFYQGVNEEFFYRQGDKELGAMSPMFLGGLTARAMKLVHQFRGSGLPFREIYPAALVRQLSPPKGLYKKDIQRIDEFLNWFAKQLPELPHHFAKAPLNWHQVDAYLAWCIGWRVEHGQATVFGSEKEGQIWV